VRASVFIGASLPLPWLGWLSPGQSLRKSEAVVARRGSPNKGTPHAFSVSPLHLIRVVPRKYASSLCQLGRFCTSKLLLAVPASSSWKRRPQLPKVPHAHGCAFDLVAAKSTYSGLLILMIPLARASRFQSAMVHKKKRFQSAMGC
jgi:hypothetical protein